MKTAVIFLGVIVAMASARNGVQVAENSGYNQNGGFQVDPGFGRPTFGQGQGSIDPGFGRPTYGNGNNGQIVDPGFYRPSVGQPVGNNRPSPSSFYPGQNQHQIIDSGFYRPSVNPGQQPPQIIDIDPGFNVRPQPGYGHYAPSHPNFGQTNSGLPQPGFGPTFVNEQPQNNGGWPRKQYNNPALRGGK